MDVFISYSRKDRETMLPEGVNVINLIRQSFDRNGISYWMDEEGIHSGESFASVISRNIAECKVFLFISSAQSNASRWTCGEIATASSYEKRIIPFKIDHSPYDPSITIYLAALDSIDYASNPDKAIRRLIKSVHKYLTELDEETKRREEEERERAEKEKINREIDRLRAENAKEVALISIEQAEAEEKVRTLDSRIDDLLREKNQLLEELTAVKSQIAGLNHVEGISPELQKPVSPDNTKRNKRRKKND